MKRKIDELVAEHVMGLKELELLSEFLPHYSTNMNDAWKVAEKIHAKTGRLMITKVSDGYLCEMEWNSHYGLSASAPMVICITALKAVGIEIEEGSVTEAQ